MTRALNTIHDVNWNFPDSSKSDGLHTIHPYPAKFIPEIPRSLIRTLGLPKGSGVLDPFCGSGTTLVEAQHAGHPATGIDLNPIACLISRVKTRPLPEGLVSCAAGIVSKARLSNEKTEVPEIPNLDHWFDSSIQEAVARLVWGIEHVDNPPLEDALRLALSSILVRVSNQDSDTRYAAVKKNLEVEDVYRLFLQAAEKISSAKWQLSFELPEVQVIEQDVLTVEPAAITHPVGLVITSPPYPNAYEYWLYHKYRMFWLGYDPLEVKRQEIGARAHYFKKNHPTVDDFRSQMAKLFNLLWEVVIPGGNVCFIVGRSKIHGRIVDNAELISDVALDAGFTQTASIPRHIKPSRKSFNLSHANIKTEHLLIFNKR